MFHRQQPFLKLRKMRGLRFTPFFQIIQCNLSNRSFYWGEETSKCRHFAVSVEYFGPETLLTYSKVKFAGITHILSLVWHATFHCILLVRTLLFLHDLNTASATGLVLWRGEGLVPVEIWSHVRIPVQSKANMANNDWRRTPFSRSAE